MNKCIDCINEMICKGNRRKGSHANCFQPKVKDYPSYEESELKELYFSDLDRELDALRESVMKSTETFKKDCIEVINFYKTVTYAVGVGYSTKEVLDNIKEGQGMTDNEIIKALECCCEAQNCTSCIYNPTKYQKGTIGCCNELMENTIDLINRQKTEIDKLKIEICALSEKRITFPERLKIVKHARAETIKEFAERLKNLKQMPLITNNDIDNLVKEMTESEGE